MLVERQFSQRMNAMADVEQSIAPSLDDFTSPLLQNTEVIDGPSIRAPVLGQAKGGQGW